MPGKSFPHYPIFLDVENRDVLIVGGGEVCARKAATLLEHGARVTVVSPRSSRAVATLANEGQIRLVERPYEEADLAGRTLVFASTDDPEVNALVARDCRQRNIPVNVADLPELCDFTVPAVVERGSIQIAVSTGGKSPALSRRLRETLQNVIGPEWSEVNELLGALRAPAKEALSTDDHRKAFFDSILAADVAGLIRDGRREVALERVAAICRDAGVAFDFSSPSGQG